MNLNLQTIKFDHQMYKTILLCKSPQQHVTVLRCVYCFITSGVVEPAFEQIKDLGTCSLQSTPPQKKQTKAQGNEIHWLQCWQAQMISGNIFVGPTNSPQFRSLDVVYYRVRCWPADYCSPVRQTLGLHKMYSALLSSLQFRRRLRSAVIGYSMHETRNRQGNKYT